MSRNWLMSRKIFLVLLIASAAMMGVAYWMENHLHLTPCPLCMTQRVFVVAVGITALAATLHGAALVGTRIYAALIFLWSVVGGGFSSRHLWLQNLPADQVPECGPSIDYILETFPPMEILEVLLRGSGDCAKVDWSFLGVSIPGWTLLGFVMIALSVAWVGFRAR